MYGFDSMELSGKSESKAVSFAWKKLDTIKAFTRISSEIINPLVRSAYARAYFRKFEAYSANLAKFIGSSVTRYGACRRYKHRFYRSTA